MSPIKKKVSKENTKNVLTLEPRLRHPKMNIRV